MEGKSVRLFLVDGSATGLVTAEVMNWTGHVLSAPRSRLPEALRREESERTGVYLLQGDDPDNPSQQMLYVGEGDTVRKRVEAHAKDESKDFWTRVCMITSKDRNLTKAHVRYLESRIIERAVEADRATLTNGTNPASHDLLPEADTSDMEFFLAQIEVVLPVIGIDLLRPKPKLKPVVEAEPLVKASTDSGLLTLTLSSKKHGYKAEAIAADNEITVLAGSTALAEPPHVSNSYSDLRDDLIAAGKMAKDTADKRHLRFNTDVTFRSPSAAASVINGRNSNGRTDWIVASHNQTLKDFQNSQLPKDI